MIYDHLQIDEEKNYNIYVYIYFHVFNMVRKQTLPFVILQVLLLRPTYNEKFH